MFKYFFNKEKSQEGFTLIEMLVAISILSLSILASFAAIQGGLKTYNFTEDKIIAYYLASEGIEFIRNLRDENAIKNLQAIGSGASTVNWLNGIAGVGSDPCFGKTCILDSPLKTISSCTGSASTCPYLRRDSTSGLYGYNAAWTVTPFRRSVTVTSISAIEYRISVTVDWTTQGSSKSYTLHENIRDWQ